MCNLLIDNFLDAEDMYIAHKRWGNTIDTIRWAIILDTFSDMIEACHA